MTEDKAPHPLALPSPPSSSSASVEKANPMSGKYGQYFDPVLPPSKEMKAIVGDMMSMAGGVAAVLLQIAEPSVGAGVAAHSSFTVRPIERGRRSIIYIYVQAFGTLAERRYITDATHHSHANIKASTYDANDIDLQLWVAATTYWSLVASWELIYGKLDSATSERVYQEFSSMATALRVPPEKWPKDRAAFEIYWEESISKLKVSEEAKKVAKLVMYPAKGLFKWRTLPAWAYIIVNGPISRVITTEMLPESVREQFGIKSTKRTRGVFKVLVSVSKVTWPMVPRFGREAMKDFYMWDMRRRIKNGKRW